MPETSLMPSLVAGQLCRLATPRARAAPTPIPSSVSAANPEAPRPDRLVVSDACSRYWPIVGEGLQEGPHAFDQRPTPFLEGDHRIGRLYEDAAPVVGRLGQGMQPIRSSRSSAFDRPAHETDRSCELDLHLLDRLRSEGPQTGPSAGVTVLRLRPKTR